jgi:hypothetical protein
MDSKKVENKVVEVGIEPIHVDILLQAKRGGNYITQIDNTT